MYLGTVLCYWQVSHSDCCIPLVGFPSLLLGLKNRHNTPHSPTLFPEQFGILVQVSLVQKILHKRCKKVRETQRLECEWFKCKRPYQRKVPRIVKYYIVVRYKPDPITNVFADNTWCT